MAELEGSLCADKLQGSMTSRWVLTRVKLCASQRLKEGGFKYTAKKKKKRNIKITRIYILQR